MRALNGVSVGLRKIGICVCVPALLSAGCMNQDQIDAQQAVGEYAAGNFVGARALLTPLSKKTNEDFVLNNARLGSTTLALYDLNASQGAFLNAYEVLNSYGVNNGGRTLGAVLVDEKIKIWRGEPFERAMANFYLGLIYYMQTDYNNARAAFENALFKLKDYHGDTQDNVDPNSYNEVDSNFVLAQYMLARCYQRLGKDDLAQANFKRVASLRPDLSALADVSLNQQSNTLLIIDSGSSPRKETNGEGTVMGFVPTPEEVGPPSQPDVYVDGQAVNTTSLNHPLEDLVVLAQDRRWQSIDTIRTIKSVLGDALIVGGGYEALTAEHRGNAAVGLGMLAAGALLKATSQADVRVWEMLPRSTFAIPLNLTPGTHNITVNFPDQGRQDLNGIVVKPSGESTYYIRAQREAANQQSWPPTTLTGWPTAVDAAAGK